MGMFIGMAVGMATTPVLVEAFGFRVTMLLFALTTTGAALIFGVWGRENLSRRTGGLNVAGAAPNPRSIAANFTGADIARLLRDRRLVVLCLLAFLGLGVFNGLTTWLELILAFHGIDAVQSGAIGGTIIVGGIFGAVVVPLFSDLARRRKPFLLLGVLVALVVVYPLCTGANYATLVVLGGVLGFFFLPSFALLLEMCAQVAGARSAGAATGLLMLAGNAGGVALIVAMNGIKHGKDFHPAVLLVVAVLVVTFAGAAAFAPETFVRAEAK
jgi:cyanate permease